MTVVYDKYDLRATASRALHYLTSMVDPDYDNLPYWLIGINENPAWAEHCRVDDAELVASWYEAIVSVRDILGEEKGADVEASFRRHIMKSWGEHGLRYHEDYPWSKTNHSSFHEMAYILSALNRMLANNPDDKEAERRASELVRGMRKLIIQRKTKTFWSGDYEEPEVIYEFPNDVYLRDGGFDQSCHTGRGELSIRNGMMLHALTVRYDQAGDEIALDLAIGIANHLLGVSRYFNWKMEFFGHVHSAVWVASGLVRLGRIAKESRYIEKGKAIYDYVRSLSSSFGWVPEYAQWHPMDEEHCETCCIKDMIECCTELIEAGYDECWNDLNLFIRNQLEENQVKDGKFVAVDNTQEATVARTYQDIDERVIGGWSGGALPNSISLSRFRSIAGCCVGTAPQALKLVWDRVISETPDMLVVNLPIEKETESVSVEVGYPNEGYICAKVKQDGVVAIRLHPWMPEKVTFSVDGNPVECRVENGLAIFPTVSEGSAVELSHELETVEHTEEVAGGEYTGIWRGPDVVDLLPHGDPLRLYQRRADMPKEYPEASQRGGGKGFNMAPTEQKR
ncbi:glycoside hydrolase family protein [Tichowtungia aerotolerans]|uniref:Uncharacterized protein n=1 Tax=Tichowtungia aerotolerans TaxID=2697043 RepID=A0A6P1M5P6_9BACT|nr:hypothetical protein [Tichowtungia aerotolerans]QHI69161.1 hypothetical protein GT409_06755 [Tichowtungia aerotolerans]